LASGAIFLAAAWLLLARPGSWTVRHGLWQTLDAITGGIWLLLTGVAMRRAAAPALGITAIVMGMASLIGSTSRVLGVEQLIAVLFPVLAAFPIWVLLVGVRLLRDRPFAAS
jgi:hypothetical protein